MGAYLIGTPEQVNLEQELVTPSRSGFFVLSTIYLNFALTVFRIKIPKIMIGTVRRKLCVITE